MITTLMIVHVFISAFLIIAVLLQFGKGAEAGLMGGASDAVMTGSQQGNILTKITVVLAVLFMANCILMAKIQSSGAGKSLMDSEKPVAAPLSSQNTKPSTPKKATPAKADKKASEKPAENTNK